MLLRGGQRKQRGLLIFTSKNKKILLKVSIKNCPHYCIQNSNLAGGKKIMVAREISDIRALRIEK